MTERRFHRAATLAAVVALGATVAACGGRDETEAGDRLDGGAAPTYPGEGAAGLVTTDDAGAAETPTTPALSGGPAGQTPDYDEVGGVGSVIETDKSSQPSSAAHNTSTEAER